jgi:sugar lactone lactonase YvrE
MRGRIALLALALAVLPEASHAQGIITTVAGNGNIGFAGDGGQATSATLGFPRGVAVDNAGNIYIADALNQRIRKVSVSGVISTYAGNGFPFYGGDGGPATSASINLVGTAQHQGLAVDAQGNLYIADTGNNRIRKVDPSGIITTFAGIGGTTAFPATAARQPVPTSASHMAWQWTTRATFI